MLDVNWSLENEILLNIKIKIRPLTISPRLIVYGFDLLASCFAFLAERISENRAFGKMAGPHNLSVKNLIKLFVFVLPTVSTILALMAMPSQDIITFLAPKIA